MRLADAGLLPYQFSDLAETVHGYVDDLEKLLSKERDEIHERNKEIDEGLFAATADPDKTLVAPKREAEAPHLNFAPIENAVDALVSSSDRYQKALTRLQDTGGAAFDQPALAEVNQMLIESERKLTTPDGLPRRSWYRHQIYAPGFYTGYDVKTIPSVREAIEQKHWDEADQQIPVVAKVLRDEATLIDSASAAIEAAAHGAETHVGGE